MGIHLREKKIGNGQVSLYLDIYHNKKRWYEFLDIRISKSKPSAEEKEKKQLAQQIRIKRENELIVEGNGLINRGKQKADFITWFELYAADRPFNNHYRQALKHIRGFQGNKPLSFHSLTAEWIKSWIVYLKNLMHNNTVRHYLKALNKALNDAEKEDIIRKNPMKLVDRKGLVKKMDSFRKAYTLAELQKLIDAPCDIPSQIKQAYLLSCFTGLRWGDVNPLRWNQIVIKDIHGEENYFIHFQQEKTEEVAYLPLSDQAVNIIKQRKTEQQNEGQSMYVFPSVKEYSIKRAMCTKANYYLKKWATAAGLDPKDMHFHTSRHTFATNVLEHAAEGDLWTVSKLLGHKSIQATQIYAKIRDNRKMAAVRALPTLNLPTSFDNAS